MHGGHSSEDEPMAEMNMIPLIDIALTLLIIMMVTTAFVRKPGVSLKLPETATHEGAPEMSKDSDDGISLPPNGAPVHGYGKPVTDQRSADSRLKRGHDRPAEPVREQRRAHPHQRRPECPATTRVMAVSWTLCAQGRVDPRGAADRSSSRPAQYVCLCFKRGGRQELRKTDR